MNENSNIIYQKLCHIAKVVLRGKLKGIKAYIKKGEKSQVYSHYILKKEYTRICTNAQYHESSGKLKLKLISIGITIVKRTSAGEEKKTLAKCWREC